MAEISIFSPSMLIWVDERQRAAIRAYGYSLRGMRACDHQLRTGRKSINAIGVVSLEGVEDVYLTEGNVNGCHSMVLIATQSSLWTTVLYTTC